MKLITLNLINFKGIKNFKVSLDGKDAAIYGDNGTGKTTVMDAFLWLLFGKDSRNQADFEIKTIVDGEAIHGVDHEVSAMIQIQTEPPTELRKDYSEKWTKKRGSAEKEFTGHTTEYFIDGVPYKEKEYKEFIASICDEARFKMLIDPYYFSSTLPWQKRREILFEVCGKVEDKDLFDRDPKFAELKTILGKRTIDDHRNVLKAQKRDINRVLTEIPARIDEATRSLPQEVSEEKGLVDKIGALRDQLQEKNKERFALQQGGGVAEKEKELADIGSKLYQIKAQHERTLAEQKNALVREVHTLETEMENIDRRVKSITDAQDANDAEIERLEASMAELRELWQTTETSVLNFIPSNTCPTCGQSLPEEQVQAARDRAHTEFNKNKAQALEKIQTEGFAQKARVNEIKKTNAEGAHQILAHRERRATLDKQATEIDKKIEAINHKADAYVNIKEHIALSSQRDALNVEIGKLRAGINQEAITRIGNEMDILNTSITEIEGKLAAIRQAASTKKRIEDLKTQERALAREYENIEHQLDLIDQFIMMKARTTEAAVNGKFTLARFKLFEVQINGGIEPCCETMDSKGIPFNSALNKGAQINIGLDIINTFVRHFGFCAPIIIDQAEAVTSIIPTDGQQIRLYVKEGQQTLKIQTQGGN